MNTKRGQAIPIAIVAIILLLGGGFIATKTIGNKEPEVAKETYTGPTFPASEDYDTSVPEKDTRDYVNTDIYGEIRPNEEEDFFQPDEDYIAEYTYDNTAPAFSDVDVEDGLAETNVAKDKREDLKSKVPESQPLPQPVQETVMETKAKVEEEERTVSRYIDVVIMNAGGARSAIVDTEIIVLTMARGNETSVNVTGWKLRSAVTGRTIEIPKAVRLFFSGSAGSKENIVLNPGSRVTLIGGRSPIGSSFIVNKCSGYLTQFQAFIPGVSTYCPLARDEVLHYKKDPSIFIDNTCMNYVDRIGRCRIVATPFPNEITPMCQEAITQNIGYNICVSRHRNESDFWTLDQRVYLNQSSEVWRNQREIIELVDDEGFVVDFVDY